MNYKIISDTSCDLTDEMKEELNVDYVPFYIYIGEDEYVDNEELNVELFLEKMISSPYGIRTACASSEEYLNAFRKAEEDNIIVVTISSKLSGSYNSAKIAVDEFRREHPEKNIALIDSKSASAGQTAVVLKIAEIVRKDISFEEMENDIKKMVDDNHTYFILESFDNLVKNGRMPKVADRLVGVLNIRPIMKAEDGVIAVHEINRGFKKSLNRLAEHISRDIEDLREKTLVISHVDGLEKAEYFEERIKDLCEFKEIVKLKTKGLATAYADNGGIVIGY